ncbi:MAG: hypothetical protein CBB79_08825 [Synechococcus sp. TMED19]|nr:MAG: hypothetical protein CBB79_08825 [Synechococcus sp. TMED19]
MVSDPLLLQVGAWLAAAAGLLGLLTVVAFVLRWGVRFRLVGVSSFTLLLAAGCAAFAISYSPRTSIEGALVVPVVYDNGGDLVVAAATADFPAAAAAPTVEQVATNLRGSGRRSSDGLVHVRLRQLQPEANGSNRPVVLAEAVKDLRSGNVELVPVATGRTRN